MSIHKSLAAKGRLKRHRNVLSRTERILKLEQEDKWGEDKSSVFSLPKVRVARLKKARPAKVEKVEAAEGAAGPEAAAAGASAASKTAGKGALGKGAPGKASGKAAPEGKGGKK